MSLTVNNKLDETELQTSVYDKFIGGKFEELTGRKFDKNTKPENVDVSINLRDLHAFFGQLHDKNCQSIAEADQKLRELTLQLETIRHAHACLESELQSKFEKDKIVSLKVPGTKVDQLKPLEESDDSAKSFRPEDGDTKADVDRKILERKMENLHDKVEQSKQDHNLMQSEAQVPNQQHYHRHMPGKCPCHINGHNHSHLYVDTHQNLPGL